jgi:hypothetical protein
VAAKGMETKKSQGKIVLERDFTGDFATDLPWHKYPSVSALNDDDKQKLVALVKDRAEAFKPNFDAIYKPSRREARNPGSANPQGRLPRESACCGRARADARCCGAGVRDDRNRGGRHSAQIRLAVSVR